MTRVSNFDTSIAATCTVLLFGFCSPVLYDGASTYFKGLRGKFLVVKPALPEDCLDTGASYAERKQQREEELKDLETALKMLSNV